METKADFLIAGIESIIDANDNPDGDMMDMLSDLKMLLDEAEDLE